MKVLLIQPPSRSIYGRLEAVAPSYPPVGLAYLCSVLEQEGHTVRIVDMDTEGLGHEGLARLCTSFKPDVVGLTSTTPTYPFALEMAELVKDNTDAKVVLGGIHVSSIPEEAISNQSVDFVIIGEGEHTICELVDAIEHKKPFSKVRGIAYRVKGKMKLTKPRPLIHDLDSLPFPAWHHFDFKKYDYGDAVRGPIAPIMTTRGCPGLCVYCCKTIFGRTYRTRSPENVLDEIEHLVKKHGIQEIHILDDTFTLNRKRAMEICEGIIKRKLDITWNCINGIRVNTVDEELLRRMKDAGCYCVAFGIESGDQKVLNTIKKGITLEQARRAVRLAKKVGLSVWGFFMLGLPGDTRESIMKTIDFACELKPNVAKFHITKPLPGSELYNTWLKEGRIKSDDWRQFGIHTPPLHDLPGVTAEEMLELQKYAFRRFYINPLYILDQFVHLRSMRQLKFYAKAMKALMFG